MAAALMSHAAAAVRRGFLLAGLLAIVAGFLGMHIITGLHGTHAITATASSMEPAPASSGATHGLERHPAAHSLQAGGTADDSMPPHPVTAAGPEPAGNSGTAVPPASCVCHSGCTDPASMHSACVPSAAATSLAAPPPGTARTPLHNPDPRGYGATRAYAYLPAGPSPGELSISRT